MPKPFIQGKRSTASMQTGYKKPTYTGANRSRPSSNAAQPHNFPGDDSDGQGGAVGGPTVGKPGQGAMARNAAAGGNSYPTSGSGQTQRGSGPKQGKASGYRSTPHVYT